jgi:UDP-N-acetylglucosamine:LPS N-acetylglucosamine transferase
MTAARPAVLILSAGVGAGHHAAAQGLREELARVAPWASVKVANGLGARTTTLRLFLERFTRWQLTRCPIFYSWLYVLGVRLRAGRWLSCRLLYRITRRRLGRLIAEHDPDVVVCTYPGITTPLGMMRLRGELQVPLCALITDIASLYFWVHRGVDLHLASYAESLDEIAKLTDGASAIVTAPPLCFQHHRPRGRHGARLRLGLDPHLPLVVVSGGGWGVGDLAGAIDAALKIERAQVVVVCGENQRARSTLRVRYERISRVTVLGYCDEMADLLAGADALIHSTCGMTCLEAAVQGCPVIAYGLKAGHIAHNTSAMARLGLIEQAQDTAALSVQLKRTIGRGPLSREGIENRPSAALTVLDLVDHRFSSECEDLGSRRRGHRCVDLEPSVERSVPASSPPA